MESMMFNRDMLVMMHMHSKEMKETDADFRRTFGSMPYYPEESQNSSLPNVDIIPANRIRIQDIIDKGPNQVHRGKFLLCRSLAPIWGIAYSNYMCADDPDGKGVNVILYSFKGNVPVGSVIALMNPWLKTSMTGTCSLRVDNPKQVVILDVDHPFLQQNNITWTASLPFPSEVVPDKDDWRAAGGRYFMRENYEKALECYSKALENDSTNPIHYANRCVTYLMLGKPDLALEDAERGLQLDTTSLKLVYRKAKALIALERFEDCTTFLKSQTSHLSDPEVVELLRTAERGLFLIINEMKSARGASSSETLNELRKAGTQFFDTGDYQRALDSFSKAIEIDSKDAGLYSKRSSTYLALDMPEMALEDADHGLSLTRDRELSLQLGYSKAKALADLKRFDDCYHCLENQIEAWMTPEMAPRFETMKQMIRQQRQGKRFSALEFGIEFDRAALVKRHMNAKKSNEKKANVENYCQIYITPQICDAPNLLLPNVEIIPKNIISLDDIIEKGPGFVHRGKFLLCRSIAPSWRMNAVNLILDDPKGENAVTMALYDVEKHSSFSNGIIPVGSMIALMNPWLKSSVAGFTILRCDNPSQFVPLPLNHPILKKYQWNAQLPFPSELESDRLKSMGTSHFADGNYERALEFYTKAIELDENNPLLYSNRAATYLALNRPTLALRDTETGLELDATNVKLIFRKAKALFSLKKYLDCVDFLKRQSTYFMVPEFQSLRKTAEKFHEESTLGKYPLAEMYEEAEKDPILNHAEFFRHDLVEVGPGKNGNERGVIAKTDIPAGTLISASKAFVYNKHDDSVRFDPTILLTYGPENSKMVATIAAKLRADPSCSREFYKLFAGDKLRWLEADEQDKGKDLVDVERIRMILRLNGMTISRKKNVIDEALWVFRAMISHSCVDINCCAQLIGDFLFIRTTGNISQGEELLFDSYCTAMSTFESRDQVLRQRSVICNCRLCLMESADSKEVREKVTKIRNGMKRIAYAGPVTDLGKIKKMEGLLQEARLLRRGENESLNMLAAEIAHILAMCYFQAGMTEEAMSTMIESERLYASLGLITEAHEQAYGLKAVYREKGDAKLEAFWQAKSDKYARLMLGDEALAPIFIRKKTESH